MGIEYLKLNSSQKVLMDSHLLTMTIAEALTSAIFEVRGYLGKLGVFTTTFVYSLAAIMLFGISLVSSFF